MSVKIGSNISSLNIQRKLSNTTQELSKTFERLSSGFRINKASDDAAGLSISQSLNTDKKVFNQGVRNLNDGISLLNIADSAIDSLSNIVVRLKELAEQSANGTYSAIQRTALDKEAQALSREYTRIAQSTRFNGVSLLNGSLSGGIRVQGGYGVDGSILSGVGGAIGTGTFGSALTLNLGDPSGGGGDNTGVHTAIGDLNGDGFNDLVVSESVYGFNGGYIGIKLGNGDGTFSNSSYYHIDSNAGSMAVLADINNDGKIDILAADSSANVTALIGKGDGTFSNGSVYTFSNGLSVGDINGDGNIDMLQANTPTSSIVRFGNGNGTFGAISTISSTLGNMKLLDLNGDGKLDMLTGGTGFGGRFDVRIGNGDGTFGSATSYQTHSTGFNSYDVGDVNGDGITDVVVSGTNGASRVLVTRFGNGDGTFGEASTTSALLTTAGSSMKLADLNGDGLADVASLSSANNMFEVKLGNGDGTFGTSVSYLVSLMTAGFNVGDLNGDGVYDVVGTGYGNVQVRKGTAVAGAGPLLPFNLTSASESRQALTAFTSKLQQLSSQRGIIGAFQSRINIAVSNLQSASENYSAAESRIMDADIAEESSRMIRLNILQQSAQSVLTQANQQPALAVTLLSS